MPVVGDGAHALAPKQPSGRFPHQLGLGRVVVNAVALEAEGAGAARVRLALLGALVVPHHQPLRLVLRLPPCQRPRDAGHHPP
ncbi:MAG TPA: hypothetical protein VFA46_21235 [Actinomycetes bacterium]|nr:hypothetical protein [Actinomycetes bacterium]